jgi:hypothetical protein
MRKNRYEGKGSFQVRVIGEEYRFWEKPIFGMPALLVWAVIAA